jgi:hypothetical protein
MKDIKAFNITYRVRGNSGDGIPFWEVIEVHGGLELFLKGVSRDKQEMIDLAEKLNAGIEK